MRSRVVLISMVLAAGGVAACSSGPDVRSTSAVVVDTSAELVENPTVTAGESFTTDGCDQDDLSGGDDSFVFVAAYTVVDGSLDGRCFGQENEVVVEAWNDLVRITPSAQLGDIGVFAGFESDGGDAEDTLAYVSVLDSDGLQFQMSINTVTSSADPDELLLTLAHEFSHVFVQNSTQLDRTDEAIDSCTTYFNGDGCFLPDSLMVAWIDEFWDPDVLADVDPSAASDDEIDARCSADEGFLGSYAASNPEEDFAEAFSAMVFRLEPATEGQAARIDWLEQQPGLVEFRDRADAANLTPLPNNFDICGG